MYYNWWTLYVYIYHFTSNDKQSSWWKWLIWLFEICLVIILSVIRMTVLNLCKFCHWFNFVYMHHNELYLPNMLPHLRTFLVFLYIYIFFSIIVDNNLIVSSLLVPFYLFFYWLRLNYEVISIVVDIIIVAIYISFCHRMQSIVSFFSKYNM